MFISFIFRWNTPELNVAMDPLSRKVVQEDVVQYKLFLIQSDDTDSQTHEERLKHLVEDILARIAPLLMKYIWQHQSFNLNFQPEKGSQVNKAKRMN